jgi:hypothetical protein
MDELFNETVSIYGPVLYQLFFHFDDIFYIFNELKTIQKKQTI